MILPSSPSGLPSYLRCQQPFWPTFWIAWAGGGLGGWVLAAPAARQVTRLFGNPAGDGGVREMLGGFALGGLAPSVTVAALLPLLLVLVYVSFV